MPYQIIRNDIVKMRVDAIVNPTDRLYSGAGGTDARIHRAAGPALRRACDALLPIEAGEAAVTPGFALPCRYVIHTIGPVWHGGDRRERETLIACYRNALIAADAYGCETVAFPLIASGTFGYPKDRVLRVALETIGAFLMTHDMTVYVVVYDKDSYAISRKLQAEIESFIDENYIEEQDSAPFLWDLPDVQKLQRTEAEDAFFDALPDFFSAPSEAAPFAPSEAASFAPPAPSEPVLHAPSVRPKRAGQAKNAAGACALPDADAPSLESMISSLDEGFAGALFRLIDRKGMTDVECYKKANIDKKLFSKIRNPAYHPSKKTILALAIALELTLDETNALLETAGLALSRSSRFDVIVKYFIVHGNYNLFEINETLYKYDEELLGNVSA